MASEAGARAVQAERGELPAKRVDEMVATNDRMSDALGGGGNSIPPNYFPKQDEGQPRH